MNQPEKQRMRTIALETVMLAALLGGLVWSIAPDVNEAHYLAKARHFWDPDFCANDVFVASHETHWLFYATHGWLGQLVEFETLAWIGRTAAWLVIALGLVLLSRSFWDRLGLSLLVGCVVVILNENLNLAGEWFVGGVEGKCYAYGLGMAALAMWFEGKVRRAWVLLGLACAFHIVVGLWLVIACGFACVAERFFYEKVKSDETEPVRTGTKTKSVLAMLVALLVALLLCAVGVWPAVAQNAEATRETILQASKAQSLWRLAHHQLATEFGRWMMFLPMVVAWLMLAWTNRQGGSRNLSRLNLVVLGSLLISCGGIVLSLVATSTSGSIEDFSAMLLTLYWFRLADVLVPVGLAINGVWLLNGLPRELAIGRYAAVTVAALVLVFIVLNFQQVRHDPRSASASQTVILPDEPSRSRRELEAERNWIKTCRWIRDNTPNDAVFITPLNQQTFKWYAQRAEVASRKDMPQDARSIVEWLRRLEVLYSVGPESESDSSSQPQRIAQEYRPLLFQGELPFGAGYIVIEQRWVDEFLLYKPLPPGLQQIYPEPQARKSTFAVFRQKDETK